MNKPLYVVSAEYRAKIDDLLERGVDEQTIADTMEGEGWEFQQKMEAVGYAIKEKQAQIEAITNAVVEMNNRCDSYCKQLDNLEKYVLKCLQLSGERKVETKHYVISRHKNPYKVVIEDYDLVPDEYKMKPIEQPAPPDRAKIRKAMKDGEYVPGCRLEQDESLRIG